MHVHKCLSFCAITLNCNYTAENKANAMQPLEKAEVLCYTKIAVFF